MDIDEEPVGYANTCSKESRRQFWITFSIFVFVCSIIYIAATIVYTMYTMIAEMEDERETHQMKILGVYDTCQNIHFNTKMGASPNEFEIVWHDVMLMPANLYIIGTDTWFITPQNKILLQESTCHSAVVMWMPRFLK